MNRSKYWVRLKSESVEIEGSSPEVAKKIGVPTCVINHLIQGIRKEVKGFHIVECTFEGKPFFVNTQPKKRAQRFTISNGEETLKGTAKEIARKKGWTIAQSHHLFYKGQSYKGYRIV